MAETPFGTIIPGASAWITVSSPNAQFNFRTDAAHLIIGHEARCDIAALSGVMAIRIPRRALQQKQ
jgi:hypothetical protein